MSNNNNDGGAAMGLALVFAAMYFMAIILYAIACFAAVIFTILSILAWDKPFRLFGHELCNPAEARVFMGCAIGGAIVIPVFALFCAFLFGKIIEDEWWFYLVTGGYVFAPWAVGPLFADSMSADTHAETPRATVIDHAPPTAPSLPPARESFTYASWDDEEKEPEEPTRGCGGCDRYR